MIKSRVSASELNHILCGSASIEVLPYDLESISDLPDLPGTTATWGIGQVGGPFRYRKSGGFDPIASLTGVLAFDRQGNGIGDGAQGRAIWRNARWHTLEAATGMQSMADRAPKKITASGLIWIGNQAATANALLVPVEIVAPTLDYHEHETEYGIMGAEELKVAKMEHSLSAEGVLDIDLDPHRFHIRIPSRLGGKAVIAKIGTVGNPEGAYNDAATAIPLTANPYQQESQSQLLVSDEVDDNADVQDEQAGDRTHRVQLGGDVEISSMKIGAVTYPFSMKVPVKVKKRLVGTIIMVGNTGEYQADIVAFNKVAKERYAQVGVDFDFDIVSMALPPAIQNESLMNLWVSGSNGNLGSPHPDFTALMDNVGALRKAITMFVVKNVAGTDRGYAYVKSYLGVDYSEKYGNVVILSAMDMIDVPKAGHPGQRAWFTIAHEMGHLLTEAGHYAPPDPNYSGLPGLANYGGVDPPMMSQNLMREGTSNANTLTSSKRIRRFQEFKFLESLFVAP